MSEIDFSVCLASKASDPTALFVRKLFARNESMAPTVISLGLL
jgi:hypothetical protein